VTCIWWFRSDAVSFHEKYVISLERKHAFSVLFCCRRIGIVYRSILSGNIYVDMVGDLLRSVQAVQATMCAVCVHIGHKLQGNEPNNMSSG
jgi:hypothetical protein